MSENTLHEIENFFLEIENLIEIQPQDEFLNQYIERRFKEGRELIDELEEDNEEQHGLFRYGYHITYANYLKIGNEVNKAESQEKLAKKYEKFFESLDEKPERMDTYKTKENTTHEALKEELKKIQDILNDNIIESIQQIFKQFDNTLKTFEDYKIIVAHEANLHKLVDNVINESLINLEKSHVSNINEGHEDQNSKIQANRNQMISSLNLLKMLASKTAYLKRLTFIRYVLNSPNKQEILFSNVPFTEEDINKRFRGLALCFHSDKTNRPYTPVWLQEGHQSLGVKIFNFALEFKESLLNDIKVKSCLDFYERKANNLWRIAIDYRNAAKGRWDKLRLIKKDDFEGVSPDDLKYLSIDTGISAYQEYRAACKTADKAKQINKQVELRGNMALSLYISDKYIEAQLYALSAIQLLLRNSQRVTHQEFINAKKTFDKVKSGDDTSDSTKETPRRDAEVNLSADFDDTFALINTVDQEISLSDRNNFQHSIKNDMTKISTELISLKADRRLICYQTSRDEILHAKNRALKHKIAGGTVIGGAAAVGGTASIAGGIGIYHVVITGISQLFGPFALIGGIAALGLGVWGGSRLWKKGSLILGEPEIRENLNNIMIRTLEAYDRGEYHKFLGALSDEFKTGESILKLKKCGDPTSIASIDPHDIIDTLLKHGFRPDGIAYLLILIGEVLSSRKIKIEGKTTRDLKAMAMNVFDGALSEKLEIEAKKLDDRVLELRKNHCTNNANNVNTINKFIDFVSLKEYSDIAQEHKDDAQEMPFKLRLEEMRNIARINRAIFYIIDSGEEEIRQAIKIIKEIQDSMNFNDQFVSVGKWRYEVLEDLLWVINGKELPQEITYR